MSFRGTLFVGITIAVVALAGLEATFDVLTDRLAENREAALTARFERAVSEVEERLPAFRAAPSDDTPSLRSEPEADVRVVARSEAESPWSAPGWTSANGWAEGRFVLNDGSQVRVALPLAWSDRVASRDLLLDLLDLPLFAAVAFLAAWLLTRTLLGPLRRLSTATEAVTQQRFPTRVDVPAGEDELAQLARRFNRMAEAIRGHLERERAFTRYASHELRTPLGALRIQVERARMGLTDPEAVLPALERNVRRMENVLAGLLALARADERDEEPRPLWGVVQESLASLPPEARARVRVDGTTCEHVRVRDGPLLQRAVQNLIDNALRYGTGPVTVRLRTDEHGLILQVIDLGPGVPESDLVHLTEPFYRGRRTGEGVGLGLALVRMIAEGLDGRFDLANHGRGLTATLNLPIIANA